MEDKVKKGEEPEEQLPKKEEEPEAEPKKVGPAPTVP